MKKLAIKNFLQKILIIIIIFILIAFTIPPRVFADDGWDLKGALLKEIVQLIASVGDIGMSALNSFMLGAEGMRSALLDVGDLNFQSEDSWLYDDGKGNPDEYIEFEDGEINASSFIGKSFAIPNMIYSPENIFANNIAALDVNFLRANTFSAITESDEAQTKSESSAKQLRTIIASWYKSFRNIAIVGLLSVLIYLGIRIVISSTADDKAKYKESIKNWLVALCLIFIIHFIMSGILMLTDRVTDLFADDINQGIKVKVNDSDNPIAFKTNLMGIVRFQAQSYNSEDATAYTIVYIILVVYTFRFTFIYFKRFLYTAFFTMIAPLVALTYPIDKAGDGKAQAFNIWFKEYTMNVIIQPVHLILYTVFVSSANDLATTNPLYAIVAIGFMIPAEKFIKKMFGLDKADSTGDFGSFAGGALAMSGLNKMKGLIGSGKSKSGGNGNSGAGDSGEERGKIYTKDRKELGSFENSSPNENTLMDNNKQSAFNQDADTDTNINTDENYANYNSSYDPFYSGSINNSGDNNIDNNQSLDQMDSINNIDKKDRRKRKIKLAKTIGKKALKGSWKVAKVGAKGAGLVGGAVAGIAVGAATGSPSKAVQYAGVGAGIGTAIGGGFAAIPEKGYQLAKNGVSGAKQKAEDLKYEYNRIMNGEEYARQQRIESHNARERKSFLNNKDEKSKYADMAAKLKYKGDQKDLMNAVFDLKEAGVKDEDLIKNALKLEMKRDKGQVGGNSHQNVIDVASFAEKNKFGKDYIEDAKKRESLDDVIESTIKNKRSQQAVGQTLADLYGRGDLYKKKSRFFKK